MTGIELLCGYPDAIYPVDYFNYLYLDRWDGTERVFHNSIRTQKKDLKRRWNLWRRARYRPCKIYDFCSKTPAEQER